MHFHGRCFEHRRPCHKEWFRILQDVVRRSTPGKCAIRDLRLAPFFLEGRGTTLVFFQRNRHRYFRGGPVAPNTDQTHDDAKVTHGLGRQLEKLELPPKYSEVAHIREDLYRMEEDRTFHHGSSVDHDDARMRPCPLQELVRIQRRGGGRRPRRRRRLPQLELGFLVRQERRGGGVSGG